MTACTIPELDMMTVLEGMVNDPAFCGHPPSFENEPYEVILPQRLNPFMLSKVERKANNRRYAVSVWFTAMMWSGGGTPTLRWKYSDVTVRELV